MNDQVVRDLIAEIACEHGVAIDRDDPILILHTATRKILIDVEQEAHQSMEQALRRHRSELEAAASRWQEESSRRATALALDVQGAIKQVLCEELREASSGVALRLEQALGHHDKALSRSTLTNTLSAAAALVAASAVVLSRCG